LPDDSRDEKTEEAEFNDALRRMLGKPPKPHKTSAEPKPRTAQSGEEEDQHRDSPKARG